MCNYLITKVNNHITRIEDERINRNYVRIEKKPILKGVTFPHGRRKSTNILHESGFDEI